MLDCGELGPEHVVLRADAHQILHLAQVADRVVDRQLGDAHGLVVDALEHALAEVEAFLKAEGIALEQSDTPNAVHTFNILNDEGRTVGGAFLTLEPRGIDEYADPLADKVT